MEGHAGSFAAGAGTSAALAFTGFNTIAYLVAGLTLLFAGLALLKLVPHMGPVHRPTTMSEGPDATADAALASRVRASTTVR